MKTTIATHDYNTSTNITTQQQASSTDNNNISANSSSLAASQLVSLAVMRCLFCPIFLHIFQNPYRKQFPATDLGGAHSDHNTAPARGSVSPWPPGLRALRLAREPQQRAEFHCESAQTECSVAIKLKLRSHKVSMLRELTSVSNPTHEGQIRARLKHAHITHECTLQHCTR